MRLYIYSPTSFRVAFAVNKRQTQQTDEVEGVWQAVTALTACMPGTELYDVLDTRKRDCILFPS